MFCTRSTATATAAQSQVADHETEVETQVCKEVVVELDHIGQSTTGVQGLNFRGKEPQPVVLESSCDGVPTSTATDADSNARTD